MSRDSNFSLGSDLLYTFGAGQLRELGDSIHFPDPNFTGWYSHSSFSEMWQRTKRKFWEDMEQSSALRKFVSDIRYVALFRN